MMKNIQVPFVPSLDNLSLEEVAFDMELKAERICVGELNWSKEFPYKPIVSVDIARGETDLYLHYFVRELSIRALSDTDGQQVYEDSCVEFFMGADGEASYINFEFNCIGTCYASVHKTREIKTDLSLSDYKRIRRHSTFSHIAFEERNGIHIWALTIAIPFDLMGLDAQSLPKMIRGNFYKCGDKTAHPHYVTWNPINLPQPNYHCPDFFGQIYF